MSYLKITFFCCFISIGNQNRRNIVSKYKGNEWTLQNSRAVHTSHYLLTHGNKLSLGMLSLIGIYLTTTLMPDISMWRRKCYIVEVTLFTFMFQSPAGQPWANVSPPPLKSWSDTSQIITGRSAKTESMRFWKITRNQIRQRPPFSVENMPLDFVRNYPPRNLARTS